MSNMFEFPGSYNVPTLDDLPVEQVGNDVILFLEDDFYIETITDTLYKVFDDISHVEVILMNDRFSLEDISEQSEDELDYYSKVEGQIRNLFSDWNRSKELTTKNCLIIEEDRLNERNVFKFIGDYNVYHVSTVTPVVEEKPINSAMSDAFKANFK